MRPLHKVVNISTKGTFYSLKLIITVPLYKKKKKLTLNTFIMWCEFESGLGIIHSLVSHCSPKLLYQAIREYEGATLQNYSVLLGTVCLLFIIVYLSKFEILQGCCTVDFVVTL